MGEYTDYEVVNDKFGNIVIQKSSSGNMTWEQAVQLLIQLNEEKQNAA